MPYVTSLWRSHVSCALIIGLQKIPTSFFTSFALQSILKAVCYSIGSKQQISKAYSASHLSRCWIVESFHLRDFYVAVLVIEHFQCCTTKISPSVAQFQVKWHTWRDTGVGVNILWILYRTRAVFARLQRAPDCNAQVRQGTKIKAYTAFCSAWSRLAPVTFPFLIF